MFVGSVGIQETLMILCGILVLVAVVLSLFIRIVFFSGLITATLVTVRFDYLLIILFLFMYLFQFLADLVLVIKRSYCYDLGTCSMVLCIVTVNVYLFGDE